eukprot:GHVO01057327.1.p2 GENE.GHVO01057327.1~~GHVO01057327.1.p2  ORF type:complete len:211 (-),score=25.67 GHVO01057327.1:238-870(-)
MSLTTAIRIAPSRAARALNLLRTVQYTHPPTCPCHSNPNYHQQTPSTIQQARRHFATPIDHAAQKEYAFEMAASSIRFGPGCTKEVGMDFKNMGSQRVMVVTDPNVRKLDAMKQVVEGLTREGVTFEVYDGVRVEPKDHSIKAAIDFACTLLLHIRDVDAKGLGGSEMELGVRCASELEDGGCGYGDGHAVRDDGVVDVVPGVFVAWVLA